MPKRIKKYDLDAGETKGSLKVFEASSYLAKHGIKAYQAHRHSFYQLIWFTSSGFHFIDYETYAHPANSFYFIDKGQVHYFCDESVNDGYLFHFNDQFLNRYEFDHDNWSHYKLFHQISSPFIQLGSRLLTMVSHLREFLLDELERKEYNFQAQSYFLFRMILLNIERAKREQHQSIINTDGEFHEVVKFHELAAKNLSSAHTLEYYASELGMSTKKLTNLISKYLGNTPAGVINDKKSMEAKRLLSNSNLSIKEIGHDLGFNQATYFTKFFKKHTGHTPKEFRNLIEKRELDLLTDG